MSTAILRSPEPESPYVYLVKRTVEACRVAKEAAATAAEGIATASCPLLSTLREREKELDRLDMEIDAGVTQVITQVTESEARVLAFAAANGDLTLAIAPPETALHSPS